MVALGALVLDVGKPLLARPAGVDVQHRARQRIGRQPPLCPPLGCTRPAPRARAAPHAPRRPRAPRTRRSAVPGPRTCWSIGAGGAERLDRLRGAALEDPVGSRRPSRPIVPPGGSGVSRVVDPGQPQGESVRGADVAAARAQDGMRLGRKSSSAAVGSRRSSRLASFQLIEVTIHRPGGVSSARSRISSISWAIERASSAWTRPRFRDDSSRWSGVVEDGRQSRRATAPVDARVVIASTIQAVRVPPTPRRSTRRESRSSGKRSVPVHGMDPSGHDNQIGRLLHHGRHALAPTEIKPKSPRPDGSVTQLAEQRDRRRTRCGADLRECALGAAERLDHAVAVVGLAAATRISKRQPDSRNGLRASPSRTSRSASRYAPSSYPPIRPVAPPSTSSSS